MIGWLMGIVVALMTCGVGTPLHAQAPGSREITREYVGSSGLTAVKCTITAAPILYYDFRPDLEPRDTIHVRVINIGSVDLVIRVRISSWDGCVVITPQDCVLARSK